MENASRRPFLVPLTLPTSAKLSNGNVDPLEHRNLMESSCSEAQATVIVSWGLSGTELAESRGAVMGCKDGTLFIFQPSSEARIAPQNSNHSRPISLIDADVTSGRSTPSFRARRHSRSYVGSRSASPSLGFHQATLNMTSRSQAVSGLSKEKVEAPKNHVDFEDEPEKLKEMLKGKGVKDKTVADNLVPNFEKGLVFEKEKPSPPPPLVPPEPISKRKDDARSLLSATPPFTPGSLSTPSSPSLQPLISSESSTNQFLLCLRCHIIPRRSGVVSAIQLLDNNRLFVVLQDNGDISVFKSQDGTCIVSSQAAKTNLRSASSNTDGDSSENIWIWKRLCILDAGESTMLLACASTDTISALDLSVVNEDTMQHRTRVVMFDLFPGDTQGSYESRLDALGQWCIDRPVEGLGLHREADNTISFVSVDTKGHFIVQQLRLLPRSPLPPAPEVQSPESSSHNLTSLPLPNPFKAMIHRSSDNVSLVSSFADVGRIVLGDETDTGKLFSQGTFISMRTHSSGDKLRSIAWTDREMMAFEWNKKSLVPLFRSPMTGFWDLSWIDADSYVVAFEDRAESYILKNIDDNDDHGSQSATSEIPLITLQIHHTRAVGRYQALQITPTSEVLITKVDKSGRREIKLISGDPQIANESKFQSVKIWKTLRRSKQDSCAKIRLCSVLPLELDMIILGYDDGLIRRSSFTQIAERRSLAEFGAVSDVPLNGSITKLHLVQNDRTHERFIVGGSEDGCLAFWTKDSLELRARWTVFTTPLAHVTQFPDENAGPLKGCVLCVSEDGTVAVIVVDGLQFLHLVPGSAAPLQRVCVGGHNMLLIYGDSRVRLWDTQTTEFWRSTSVDKAEELLSQGGWAELSLEEGKNISNSILTTLQNRYQGLDTLSTVLVNLEGFLLETATVVKGVNMEKPVISSTLQRLRSLLSTLLTPGLSEDIDYICRDKLHITASSASAGFSSLECSALFAGYNALDPWCVSPEFSAARALSITSVLRVLSLVEGFSDNCNTVVTFYATSLASVVGPSFQAPSLAYLARHWFESTTELRQAARILFDAGISRLSDEETIVLAEQWQHDLPCLQPDVQKELMPAAKSLFLCGYLAAEKYSLLSTSGLTDISKSIAMYLHDENSLHRVLAIDLCSRGYHIWQHYVDAIEMLRALFTLATSSRKESISTQNVGSQARLAVLQIAASNTPLFMTTLGLDILHPRSVEHRKSTLQLVAFLIRKRPLVLYPNLPRLMEAVVKSLDPNSTTSRDAVLDTATEILGHVVKTFPTVDFYMPNQRLAVGTSEGAIVMYDLKTGTRLYVLEGHKKRPAACSFSPDGRRLVTVSLEEGVVLVWKVGSSFSSFFNPGAPPRQGHGGSQPFKTLAFNVGDEANMSVAGTLESVRFEWTAERSVKLLIRESVLTFST